MKVIVALVFAGLHLFALPAHGQQSILWVEQFDSARAPLLPPGWTASKAKSAAGDFSTSASTPRSAPLAALSTDARIAQSLTSPAIAIEGRSGVTLEFYERRSSSFTAGVVVECTTRSDSLSWQPISDTLVLVNSSSYVRRQVVLPATVNGAAFVRFRWRTLGNGTGATGTFRLDDITVSVQPAVDLALDPAAVVPVRIAAGEDAPCAVTVRNFANAGSYTFSLSLADSTLDRRIADTTITRHFAEDDSLAVMLLYARIASGVHQLRLRLSLAADEDTLNNTASAVIAVGSAPADVIINEIMYEPRENSPEYVELYNRTDHVIDLGGWNLGDASGTSKNRATIPLPKTPHPVPARTLCVVAGDSSIIGWIEGGSAAAANVIVVPSLGLNNSGDDVVLFDPSGATVDSVRYAPSWHRPRTPTAGRSLERINPDLPGSDARNWSTSVAVRGGTPGAVNSIFTTAIPADASLALSPNPFSPNNDGAEDFLGIVFTLPSPASSVRVRIFDAAGRLVCTLANNEPAASAGTIFWNGRDDTNTRVRMGMYIVFVEALDPRGGVLRTMKGVAVVATKLE